MYVNGMGFAFAFITPYIVHKLLAGKDFSREGCHFIEQHKFLLGQNHFLSPRDHRQRVALENGIADDLTALARHVAKIETLDAASALANADVDDNGTLSADDLTKLARYVAKIINTLD